MPLYASTQRRKGEERERTRKNKKKENERERKKKEESKEKVKEANKCANPEEGFCCCCCSLLLLRPWLARRGNDASNKSNPSYNFG
jgi:hypothetical protein